MINRKQITFEELSGIHKAGKRYAFISDIHLGHDRTLSWYIADSMNTQVLTPVLMATYDAIFIPGDLFDKLLHNSSVAMDDIHDWIERLLRLSKRTNTPIRILEGTPSHDWKQSSIIDKLNVLYAINADVKYYAELSVVYDDTLDITIGYVPDEWRECCDQTTVEFKDILSTKGYASVDLIIMHGMFEFQIPKAAAKSISHFKERDWEPLANYGIVIGHDHRHKSHGNITVPGSWERLAHNEEDAKGCLIMDISNQIVDIYHVVNDKAMLYLTIDGVDKTDIEVIELTEKALHRFGELDSPIGRIKVKYNRDYDISSKLSEWKNAFNDVIVEGASESTAPKVESVIDGAFRLESAAINITPSNITGMIHRELEGKYEVSARLDSEIATIMASM